MLKATLFCSKCQHVGQSTRFSVRAGLSPTAIHRYCHQTNVFDSKMLQTHHPESLRCLWGRATLCQTVGSDPAHHHGDPSIGECVQNLAALLIPHSLVCLPHTFLSVSLLLFLLFIGITSFHSKMQMIKSSAFTLNAVFF